MIWPLEVIPNTDQLYCYIHKTHVKNGRPIEKAFRNTPFEGGTDLSSDWDRYSTPAETRERLSQHFNTKKQAFKNPEEYYVLKFKILDILNNIPVQKIEHDPLPNQHSQLNNRAHTKISGEKDEEARLKFVDAAVWTEICP